nr:hypothetical protein Iba_chr07fCG10590 [Ipomoea batatas]
MSTAEPEMSHSRYSKNDVAQDSSERPGKQLSRGMPAMSSSSHYGGGQHAASRHSLDPSSSRTLSVGHECDEVFGTRKWKWIPKSDINKQQQMATSDHEKGNESPTTAKETDLAQENENLSRVAGSEIDKTVENMNLDYSHSEPTKMEEAGGENSNVEATNINPEECEFGIMRNMQVVKGINLEATGKKKVGKKKRNKNKEKLDRSFFADLESPEPSGDNMMDSGGGRRVPTFGVQC